MTRTAPQPPAARRARARPPSVALEGPPLHLLVVALEEQLAVVAHDLRARDFRRRAEPLDHLVKGGPLSWVPPEVAHMAVGPFVVRIMFHTLMEHHRSTPSPRFDKLLAFKTDLADEAELDRKVALALAIMRGGKRALVRDERPEVGSKDRVHGLVEAGQRAREGEGRRARGATKGVGQRAGLS
eukprot:CAMPEP_0179267788 /NCGR_PEP_ID=MMETSP0797-20121207/30104_1 /TAXON_ID=47934 /ORGANISM="Dinophysis acuminata, Strain DAEP01" /LENGTH=183 /DNA_ID=CAMNT_0020976047 /DNA_START=6 /DNA_END=554 /DNA_ORIENTATION=+